MRTRCHGRVHCHTVDCERCAWRYSLRIARRIAIDEHASFYAITIEMRGISPEGFREWRTRIRNRLDYLRRSAHWKKLGLHVWICQDGKLRGIISLGALGPAEV